MNQVTTGQVIGLTPASHHRIRAAGTLMFGLAAGAILTAAVVTTARPHSAVPSFEQTVTDGWARSAITRAGGLAGYSAQQSSAATDGWAHSRITRAGGVDAFARGTTGVTDGWIVSPITRAGGLGAHSGS